METKTTPTVKKKRAKRRKGSKYYALKPRVKRKCANCGATFVTVRDTQRFCCPKCKNEYHYKPVNKLKTCAWCGAKFVATNKRTHCSDECTRLHKIERLKEARLAKARSEQR